MKKIIALLLTTILLSALTFSFNAQAVFETAYDLNQMWAPSNTYPDYVCGVWSNDGSQYNLTIAVLDTEEGNRGKEEILELIEDDSSVTFTYGEYSRNYLTDVQDELIKLYKTNEEHGLISTALNEYENRIALGILKEYKGNEKTELLLSDLKAQYGDIFTVSYCDPPVEEVLITAPVGEAVTLDTKPHLSTIILIILLLTSVAFMVIRKRNAYVMKTNTGKSLTAVSPTEKEIEHAIKNTDIDYPQALDKKVMDEIDNK